MKQNDVALLILIVVIAAVGSAIIGGKVIRPQKNRTAQVEVAERISPEFPQPDATVFNDKALNPTKEIKIGNDNNGQPIKNESQ